MSLAASRSNIIRFYRRFDHFSCWPNRPYNYKYYIRCGCRRADVPIRRFWLPWKRILMRRTPQPTPLQPQISEPRFPAGYSDSRWKSENDISAEEPNEFLARPANASSFPRFGRKRSLFVAGFLDSLFPRLFVGNSSPTDIGHIGHDRIRVGDVFQSRSRWSLFALGFPYPSPHTHPSSDMHAQQLGHAGK